MEMKMELMMEMEKTETLKPTVDFYTEKYNHIRQDQNETKKQCMR